jgi:hypothetical protein
VLHASSNEPNVEPEVVTSVSMRTFTWQAASFVEMATLLARTTNTLHSPF